MSEHAEEHASPDDEGVDADALLTRLRVIEDQPLQQRADAFGQLHDELRARLEGGDTATPPPHA